MDDHGNTDSERKVRQAARAGCSNREIAQLLGLTTRDLLQRYRREIEQERAELRKEIREKQLEIARKGGRSKVYMLIWLGKQYLGQTEPRPAGQLPLSTEFRVAGLTREQVIERLQQALRDQEECQPPGKNGDSTSSSE